MSYQCPCCVRSYVGGQYLIKHLQNNHGWEEKRAIRYVEKKPTTIIIDAFGELSINLGLFVEIGKWAKEHRPDLYQGNMNDSVRAYCKEHPDIEFIDNQGGKANGGS